MSVENWPESVAGWELYRHGREENYRKRMANGLTVFATWDGERRSGVVEARVDPTGIGRTIASSRKEFRDKDAFSTAETAIRDPAKK